MAFENLIAYEVLKEEELKDIHSKGYILRHKKSGARIVLVSNKDENKVFFVGFRTPPKDETGVPHIIEHTVLCGSEKFPLKDPFVELVKGSMNTFLNAMTYPDKTVYPIASCNDKDFHNLMDVYMDAVFHPNIYKDIRIFKQEGWHYELEEKDAPLMLNGVVYNEMKGAYSSAEDIMAHEINKALFPDNTYGKNSGGNPDVIPELTYEDYLNFHRKYYSPSNSYIYLYGDMDMEEQLIWLDQAYLSEFDIVDVDSTIPFQKSFEKMKDVEVSYPISSEEEEEENYYLSYSMVIGDALDRELYQAMDILDYALLSVPGAPLKTALLDAGIGLDITGGFDSGSLQPTFSIDAKNVNSGDKERFIGIIRETLEKVVEEGIDRKALLAGINSNEFRFREADFGRFPKGLLYGLQMLDSWLFDDMQPFVHIQCLDTYAFLKEQLNTNYFEELVKKYLLDNPHSVLLTLVPEKGLGQKRDKALADKLAAYKASLSDEEIEKIIAETKDLKEFQEAPTPKEDLEKIPMLSRDDIRKKVAPVSNIEEDIDGVKVVRHEEESNGINYMNFMFDARDIAQEDIPYLGILKSALSYVDTDTISYGDLSNEINIYTGGISSTIDTYTTLESKEFKVFFTINVKTMEENLDKAMDILLDFMMHSHLNDEKRIKEILSQIKARKLNSLSSGGNTTTYIRAMSGFSNSAYYIEAVNGIMSLRLVSDLESNFDEKKEFLFAKLEELCKKLFTRERLTISFTGTKDQYDGATDILAKYMNMLPSVKEDINPITLKLEKKNEAFTDASQVQYVSKVGDFGKYGHKYSGSMAILKNILSYDYLWVQVRVLGGAYGCHGAFYRTGECVFSSYRDPNLTKTLEVYDGVVDYLKEFNPDERDMTKYIIGTFSEIDRPLYPEAKGNRALSVYLTENTVANMQEERDQILNTYAKDIQEIAPIVEDLLKDAVICVLGNEDVIRKEGELFDHIESLS